MPVEFEFGRARIKMLLHSRMNFIWIFEYGRIVYSSYGYTPRRREGKQNTMEQSFVVLRR
jgi:hypothetical protein